MNAYKFSYEGMWLGGIMIVIAPNKEIAEKLAREKLKSNNTLKGKVDDYTKNNLKTLKLEEEMSIVEARVIYDDNGNY